MASHTPGPWWRDDDGFVAAGFGEDYITIATANCTNDIDIEEREANTSLIAAAPDMLVALDMILDADGDLDAIDFNMIRKATEKARGE